MNSEINEATEKYAKTNYPNAIGKPYSQADFYAGATSDAAKEYWVAQFQSQKQSAVWVKASEHPHKEGTYFCKHFLYKSELRYVYTFKNGIWYDQSTEEKLQLDERFYWLDETPQPQLSDEEIEKLAEKEYPYKDVSVFDSWKFFNLQQNISRTAFIKGYKAALQ
jgi:hypothetical protein